ncbi:unnamed protein product [Urochloa humidicola]
MAVGTQKDLHTSNYHGNEGSEGDHLAATCLRGTCNVELGLGVLPSQDYTHGFFPMTMMRGCEERKTLL